MILPLLLLLLVTPAEPRQISQEELTKLVSTYDLTMAKIDGYGAVTAGIAEWAAANPKPLAALMARAPKGTSTVAASGAVFESEPAVKALLDRHKITGIDMVVLPMAVMQAQILVLADQQGRTVPPGPFNPKNVPVVKANGSAIDKVMTKARADMARAFGR
jgi:hypothetical protein